MEPVKSTILGALVAGATSAASETASQAVKDAYQGLKIILVDVYKLASTSLLEKKPSDTSFQKAVETELTSQPAIVRAARAALFLVLAVLLAACQPKTRTYALTVVKGGSGSGTVAQQGAGPFTP
jgi:hypothetical protein